MSDEQSTNQGGNPPPTDTRSGRFLEHIKANKVDVALWSTRLLTIIFTVAYLIPVFGNAQSYYTKVLLANAATSALRLHQRIPTFGFTREFLGLLLQEDSCHYLFFSVIFLYVYPVLVILLPIFLFALLHASSFSLKILDILGQNSWWGARFFISIVEFQTTNILRSVAFLEIFIMPLSIVLVFMGRAGLMTPFIYYHFLSMRYMSRRNQFTRQMFTEIRMATDALAVRSPPFIARILTIGVGCITRLAPQQPMAAQ